LVNYIGVQQGALLILIEEGNQKWLEMIACYAYDRAKHGVEKKVKLGEGMVGQTFLEKKSIYLTNIPQDYVHIESALGDANPRSIFIVPLKINEQAVGVLELASLHPMESHVLSFVEKLAESIAGSISNVKVNEMTRRLLAQSQEQANLLLASEEELRQNMEELQTTQDAIQRNTHELSSRINLIDDAGIASLEMDIRGNILDANNTFLRLLEYYHEDILSRKYTFLVDEEYANSSEYKEFWNKLMSGKNVEGEFQYITKNKKVVYIKGVYSVLKDLQDKPTKIIQLGTDITAFKNKETINVAQ
jgi:PAS domain S-box-containing protein